jgi:5'-nucleotidase
MRRATVLTLATSLYFGCNSTTTTGQDEAATRTDTPVQIRIIAINDLHGNIADPNAKVAGVQAGGAAYLATHVNNLRAENPNNVFVAAGDLIGASPLLSAAFDDEPTILVMNQMGLALSAVGNHEFDKGQAALKRMQEGGCDPVAGCFNGVTFPGASFDYLSADVLRNDTNSQNDLTFFRGYHIRSFQGFKIAFVGTVLDETPTIAFPDNIAGLTFEDEATAVNNLVPEIRAQGVQAIVVLTHEGNLNSSAAPYETAATLRSPATWARPSRSSTRWWSRWSAATRTAPTTACCRARTAR